MKYSCLILFCAVLAACTPITQSTTTADGNAKVLRLMDFAYEPQIKTIQLAPDGTPALPAVTALGQWNLLLQFDDLRAERDSYYLKLIHCNHDWTKSDLQDLDFMTIYNEFPVNNSEFSVDTHVPYVHYWVALPGVKIPGNYVAVVYRGGDKSDIVATKRFLVFDSQVSFTSNGNLIGPGSIANINQQLNFNVNYQNVNIMNPLVDVHVNIRQNQRWDNMATDIKPSFVHEIDKELEYRFFDESKMFRGGNEFRFFDLRSLNYPGRNIAYVDKKQKPFEAFVALDKSRNGDPYSQYNDIDGAFNIDNLDYNKELAFANYVNVNFTLNSPPVNGDVYVAGGFNYWNLDKNNKMQYDSAKGQYKARVFLKQGWYDYQYLVKSPTLPPYYLEGSHFETENYYEILVYYRPFQPRADLLIGYLRLDKNPR